MIKTKVVPDYFEEFSFLGYELSLLPKIMATLHRIKKNPIGIKWCKIA